MNSVAGLHLLISWEHLRQQPKGCLARAGSFCILEGAPRLGALPLGRNMPLTSFRVPLRADTDHSRFARLVRVLERIRGEITRETKELRQSGDKMTDCAAFSFEAMGNGEAPESMSQRIDILTRNLASNRKRQASLAVQMAFIDRTRAWLASILPSGGV
jgi:hypothetical protein